MRADARGQLDRGDGIGGGRRGGARHAGGADALRNRASNPNLAEEEGPRRRRRDAIPAGRIPTVDEIDALVNDGNESASIDNVFGGGGIGSQGSSSSGGGSSRTANEDAVAEERRRRRMRRRVADAAPGVVDEEVDPQPMPPLEDGGGGVEGDAAERDRSPSLIQPMGGGGGGGAGEGEPEEESDVVMDAVRAPLRGFEWFHALPPIRSKYCYVCWSKPSTQNRYLEIVNEMFSWRMRMPDEIIVNLVHRIYHDSIRHSTVPAKPEWDARIIYEHMTKHVKTEETLLATTINQTVALVDSLVETFESVDPTRRARGGGGGAAGGQGGGSGGFLPPDRQSVKTLLMALQMQARLSAQLGSQRARAAAAASAGGSGFVG